MEEFKKGDKVKHRFRNNQYQKCIVVEVENGCNGRIIVVCEDGFYGGSEKSAFAPQDLVRINN